MQTEQKRNFKVVFNRSCCHGNYDQNLSSVYFSLAKFQLVSCNLSLAMIWQMTYTLKLPKLCSATLSSNCDYICKERSPMYSIFDSNFVSSF